MICIKHKNKHSLLDKHLRISGKTEYDLSSDNRGDLSLFDSINTTCIFSAKCKFRNMFTKLLSKAKSTVNTVVSASKHKGSYTILPDE